MGWGAGGLGGTCGHLGKKEGNEGKEGKKCKNASSNPGFCTFLAFSRKTAKKDTTPSVRS